MKEVIRINEEEKKVKPVEFTHYLDESRGWEKTSDNPDQDDEVIYLGCDIKDGDMFAVKGQGYIIIYKGHLNSGKY